jgi:hypothetical protein
MMSLVAHTAGALRCLNALTGAVLGAVPIAFLVLVATIAESSLGRPSSTTSVGFVMAMVFGVVGAVIGATVGLIVGRLAKRVLPAGPANPALAFAVLIVVTIVPAGWAVYSVRQYEADNTPRVVQSTGAITRVEAGGGPPITMTPATLVYATLPEQAAHRQPLSWNGRPVGVSVEGSDLVLMAGGSQVSRVDLSRLDYVREVVGVTGALDQRGPAWLALLVRLRASGRRELLLVFDPRGKLVHEELLERKSRLHDAAVMWISGVPAGGQELAVDVGTPLRYAALR